MSLVAPQRNAPPPLRINRLPRKGKGKGKELLLDESPTTITTPQPVIPIPVKSPRRQIFSLPANEQKYAQKSLPQTPKSSAQRINENFQTQASPYPSLPTPTRSSTRFSGASTAVGSSSSSPSPIGPFLPPPPISQPTTPPPPLRRVPTSQSVSGRRSLTVGEHPALSTRHKFAEQANSPFPAQGPGRATAGQKFKDGTFFAFILLPLSCWYTRGGKRLKELDMKELEEEIEENNLRVSMSLDERVR